jgi:hypothetical protein
MMTVKGRVGSTPTTSANPRSGVMVAQVREGCEPFESARWGTKYRQRAECTISERRKACVVITIAAMHICRIFGIQGMLDKWSFLEYRITQLGNLAEWFKALPC